jgi:hypothetical protein
MDCLKSKHIILRPKKDIHPLAATSTPPPSVRCTQKQRPSKFRFQLLDLALVPFGIEKVPEGSLHSWYLFDQHSETTKLPLEDATITHHIVIKRKIRAR